VDVLLIGGCALRRLGLPRRVACVTFSAARLYAHTRAADPGRAAGSPLPPLRFTWLRVLRATRPFTHLARAVPAPLEIRGWVRSELVLSVGRGFSPTGRPSTLPPLWLAIRPRITRAVRSTGPAYRVALWAPAIASRAMGYEVQRRSSATDCSRSVRFPLGNG